MKTMTLLGGLAATLLLNGCIGILPVPPNRDEPVTGTPLTPDQIKFIVHGQTTRAEVIAHLGDHFRESPREPVMAYSWEKPTWCWCWWYYFFVPKAYVVIYGGEHVEGNEWCALFLKYDFAGHVEKTEFAALDNDLSLDEQMENWSWGKSRSFFDGGGDIVNPTTGTPVMFDWANGHLMNSDPKVFPSR